MNAIILAAGKGERLGKITEKLPKPMIKIDEKSIIQHNIELCHKNYIFDIFINLYHLSSELHHHIKHAITGNIHYSYERELLGTSGGVKKIIDDFHHFYKNFFVIYGDNYHSNIDFDSLIKKSEETDAIAVISFHYREDVENSGVAEFDENGRILSFIEKPEPGETNSQWVNAGVYYLNPKIMDFIPEGYSDFSKDIFPLLLKNNIPIYGICGNSIVKAFDTPEMLLKNM